MTQEIWRILGVILIVVCIGVYGSCRLYQAEKASSQFEIAMLKDISRIGRQLKEAGLDDKTVQILKYALEDVQGNTQKYVRDKSRAQFFSVQCLAIVFVAFWVNAVSRRVNQEKPNT